MPDRMRFFMGARGYCRRLATARGCPRRPSAFDSPERPAVVAEEHGETDKETSLERDREPPRPQARQTAPPDRGVDLLVIVPAGLRDHPFLLMDHRRFHRESVQILPMVPEQLRRIRA